MRRIYFIKINLEYHLRVWLDGIMPIMDFILFTLLNNFKLINFMYYVYVLRSFKDKKFYTGYSKDLKLRFEQHQKGYIESTKNRRPLELIYYEACLNQQDALHREKYLKTYHGKMFLKNRLKSYLTG